MPAAGVRCWLHKSSPRAGIRPFRRFGVRADEPLARGFFGLPNVHRQIAMYYGNPSAEATDNAAAVWSNGYVGVWHMGDLEDSTSFGHDGTNQGSTSAAGRIGNGRSFNGQGYVYIASTAALQITGTVSIEAWSKPSSPSLT